MVFICDMSFTWKVSGGHVALASKIFLSIKNQTMYWMRSSALILGNSRVLKKASNKTKMICSVTDRKPFVARGFCGVKISPELWLVQYEKHSRRILGVHITGWKWHHITVKRNRTAGKLRTAEWRINVAFLDWGCTVTRYTSRRRVFSTKNSQNFCQIPLGAYMQM